MLALLAEGAPNKVIARRLNISVHTAKFHVAAVLEKLETGEGSGAVAALADDLPLFSAHLKRAAQAEPAKTSPVLDTLKAVNPDDLTAREALDLVYRLRAMLGE